MAAHTISLGFRNLTIRLLATPAPILTLS